MATAPNPKKLSQAKRDAEATRLVWKITVRSVETILRRADLGPADARLVRQQTGERLVDVIAGTLSAQGDVDYITILWWLGRRQSGEPTLLFPVAENEFPSYEDMMNDLTLVSIVVEFLGDESEDGSPEA